MAFNEIEGEIYQEEFQQSEEEPYTSDQFYQNVSYLNNYYYSMHQNMCPYAQHGSQHKCSTQYDEYDESPKLCDLPLPGHEPFNSAAAVDIDKEEPSLAMGFYNFFLRKYEQRKMRQRMMEYYQKQMECEAASNNVKETDILDFSKDENAMYIQGIKCRKRPKDIPPCCYKIEYNEKNTFTEMYANVMKSAQKLPKKSPYVSCYSRHASFRIVPPPPNMENWIDDSLEWYSYSSEVINNQSSHFPVCPTCNASPPFEDFPFYTTPLPPLHQHKEEEPTYWKKIECQKRCKVSRPKKNARKDKSHQRQRSFIQEEECQNGWICKEISHPRKNFKQSNAMHSCHPTNNGEMNEMGEKMSYHTEVCESLESHYSKIRTSSRYSENETLFQPFSRECQVHYPDDSASDSFSENEMFQRHYSSDCPVHCPEESNSYSHSNSTRNGRKLSQRSSRQNKLCRLLEDSTSDSSSNDIEDSRKAGDKIKFCDVLEDTTSDGSSNGKQDCQNVCDGSDSQKNWCIIPEDTTSDSCSNYNKDLCDRSESQNCRFEEASHGDASLNRNMEACSNTSGSDEEIMKEIDEICEKIQKKFDEYQVERRLI